MADYNGRFFSLRDRNLVSSLNNELKNNIVEILVVFFKIATNETNINIYGEAKASEGKSFYPGVESYCWIERADMNVEDEGFGVDGDQDLEFRFTEEDMQVKNYYPEIGDLIFFNSKYYEIENVLNDKQLLGGQASKNLSFLIKTHLTKLSSINLVNSQV